MDNFSIAVEPVRIKQESAFQFLVLWYNGMITMEYQTFLSLIDRGETVSLADALRGCPELAAAQDRLGWTALHRAASRGGVEAVQVLLAAGALVEAEDRRGETPLFFSAGKPLRLAQNLLAGGANPNHRNSLGDTPLFAAADAGAVDLVRLLVEAGADPCARNESGQTALHAAAAGGNAGVVDALLNCGAEVDARDSDGRTPLHWVVTSPGNLAEHAAIVARLLHAGANPAACTLTGENALSLAERAEAGAEILALLRTGD